MKKRFERYRDPIPNFSANCVLSGWGDKIVINFRCLIRVVMFNLDQDGGILSNMLVSFINQFFNHGDDVYATINKLHWPDDKSLEIRVPVKLREEQLAVVERFNIQLNEFLSQWTLLYLINRVHEERNE